MFLITLVFLQKRQCPLFSNIFEMSHEVSHWRKKYILLENVQSVISVISTNILLVIYQSGRNPGLHS